MENIHFLVIDDNEADRLMTSILIAKVLKTENVHFAFDGEDGIEWLNNNKHILKERLIIFLDIFMPNMDGFEFLRTFYQFHHELAPLVEIHMLTSSIDPLDEQKAMKYPMVKSFVQKPFTVSKMTAFLETRMRQRIVA